MIGGAGKLNPRFQNAVHRTCQIRAARIHNRCVIETRASWLWRTAVQALPCIQRDVMVISANRQKYGAVPTLRHRKTENVAENARARDVGQLSDAHS